MNIAVKIMSLEFSYYLLSAGYLINVLNGCDQGCFPCKVRDCQDAQYLGFTESGVFHVSPDETIVGYDVYCDMKTAGGGWLVIQRRVDDSVDFFRGWDDYVRGFGNITGNLWLGNDALHTITSQGRYELRVELLDWEGNRKYAEYKVFKVASMEESYKLSVTGYTGDAGDSLSYHHGQAFATKDRDDTEHGPDKRPCSSVFQGAWWYKTCQISNLNGVYLRGQQVDAKDYGVTWKKWRGKYYSLKRTEMKIRRK